MQFDQNYQHFHTIKSILNNKLRTSLPSLKSDFHTIKSILNNEAKAVQEQNKIISILLSLF